MVFFCNIDDYAQLTHALQVFLSPFLQKGDRLRFLLAKTLIRGIFPPPFLQKGDSLQLLLAKAVSRGILTKQLAQKLAQYTKKYKKKHH